MFRLNRNVVTTIVTSAVGVAMTTGVGFAAEKGVVTTDSLNIRKGPSTSYSIITKLPKGTEVNIESKNNGWYEVNLANGQKGWASGNYIEIKGTITQEGSILGDTYLRAENKWSCEKLELLKKGVKVEVISVDENWTKVKYNGQVGYISNDYIEVKNISSGSSDNVSMNTGSILGDTYLRAENKWSCEKLELLKKGVTVEILSKDENWTKVKYNGQIGYISNDYVQATVTSGGSSDNVVMKKGSITGDTYLRAENKWSSEKLELLKKGVTVEILSKDENWTKVKYNGQIGYISNDYVQEASGSTESTTKEKIGVVVTDSLNVRSGAGTSYSILTKVTRWEKVTILDQQSGWFKIKTASGTIGWASSSYIDIIDSSSNESDVNSKIDAVIKLAKAQLGKPYEWGATGPNTFDCSGLVWYVYKNAAGINLPRVSRDQAKYGTAVSKDNIKVGDLVAFDGNQDGVVEHIGIYVGNGEFIHSPKAGDVVKISSLSTSYYQKGLVAIRRVL